MRVVRSFFVLGFLFGGCLLLPPHCVAGLPGVTNRAITAQQLTTELQDHLIVGVITGSGDFHVKIIEKSTTDVLYSIDYDSSTRTSTSQRKGRAPRSGHVPDEYEMTDVHELNMGAYSRWGNSQNVEAADIDMSKQVMVGRSQQMTTEFLEHLVVGVITASGDFHVKIIEKNTTEILYAIDFDAATRTSTSQRVGGEPRSGYVPPEYGVSDVFELNFGAYSRWESSQDLESGGSLEKTPTCDPIYAENCQWCYFDPVCYEMGEGTCLVYGCVYVYCYCRWEPN